MAKTIDSPSIEDLNQQQQKTLETTRRNNHWLTGAVIVLAIALVALGTWAVLDSSSEPATAATDEIQALYDDYIAAWSEIDADAFLATTTEDYVQYSFGIAMSQSSRAAVIRTTPSLDVELVGELVVMADGTNYYVAAAERVTILEQEYQGVSAYRVVPTPDGLRISEHTWVGNL